MKIVEHVLTILSCKYDSNCDVNVMHKIFSLKLRLSDISKLTLPKETKCYSLSLETASAKKNSAVAAAVSFNILTKNAL